MLMEGESGEGEETKGTRPGDERVRQLGSHMINMVACGGHG